MSLAVEQIEERKTGIGGSDAAAILGLSPWATPWDVWLEKIGQAASKRESEAMRWGTLLEPVIRAAYAEQMGVDVIEVTKTQRRPYQPWMLANLDGVVMPRVPGRRAITKVGNLSELPGGQAWGLEIKAVSERQAHEWCAPGTDQVPVHYLLQCAHYMAVTRFSRWDVAVLIGGQKLQVYHLERDLELEELLIEEERRFWFEHVLEQVPPVEGFSEAAHWIKSWRSRQAGEMLPADSELTQLALERQSLAAQIALLEPRKTQIEDFFRAVIGPASGVEGADWQCTWTPDCRGVRSLRFNFKETP